MKDWGFGAASVGVNGSTTDGSKIAGELWQRGSVSFVVTLGTDSQCAKREPIAIDDARTAQLTANSNIGSLQGQIARGLRIREH